MRSVSSAVLLFALWTGTIAQPTNPYVGYSFFETRRTESDHREIMTQIFLTADDYVGYRYLEDVYGSTNPTVRSVEFSNEHRRKATAQEQADLVQALLAAKVFELTDDPKPASYDYSANLDVRIGGKEVRAYFHSPPQAPGRKGVHDIMLRFARQMKIDQPEDPVTATTISEGDRQPPRVVTLADVLAHPDDYHGKRVSVVGYYHVEFESSNLAVDRAASWGPDVKRSVWRARVSTFADQSAIKDIRDGWVRVEGSFLRGPGGHMGRWPGEIVRVTRIEAVPEPSQMLKR